MTQKGVVTRLYPGGLAEVAVYRETACGGNCESCGGCAQSSVVKTKAQNPLHAAQGDQVEVTTRSLQVIGIAALVYLVPIVAFFLGYALSVQLGLSENASILVSIGFLLLGVAVYTLLGRSVLKKRQIEYTITSILKETRDG